MEKIYENVYICDSADSVSCKSKSKEHSNGHSNEEPYMSSVTYA